MMTLKIGSLKKIGSGAQGVVYIFNNDTALKIFNNKVNQDLIPIIRYNLDHHVYKTLIIDLKKYDQTPNTMHFVFPHEIIRLDSGENGYTMDLIKNAKKLSSSSIYSASIKEKLQISLKIAKMIRVIHYRSCLYCDLNPNNILINGQHIYLIDCENVIKTSMLNSKKSWVRGTDFYVLPSLIYSSPSFTCKNDLFALSMLIFNILMGNQLETPYSGSAMSRLPYQPQDWFNVKEYEDNKLFKNTWRNFVFDPKNKTNIITDKNIINSWKKIDDNLKKLFFKTFNNPFDDSSIPQADEWILAIEKALEKC